MQKQMLRYAGISAEKVASASRLKVEDTIKNNFESYGKSNQNKWGGNNSTKYWLRASDATVTTSSGGTITAQVAEGKTSLVGVRRHYTGGGTIRPKNISEITQRAIKFLTIPARAEAHGKTVATLRSTGVNLYRSGGVLKQQTGAKRSDNDPVYFYLAKQVGPMKPNPRILPTDAQFVQAISDTVDDILATPNG